MTSLANKTALITGGAQGIGAAIARRLARDGVAVAVIDVNAEKAESTAAALQETGARAMSAVIDVTDRASVVEGVAAIAAELGPPAILVNNAGVYKSTPLLDTSAEIWNLSLDVMLKGTLLMSQAAAPHMIRPGWGRIINLGSMMGSVAYGEDLAYCTAKSGILGLSRSLSAELAKHNICVNTICPGNILTPMLEQTAQAIKQRDGLETGSWLRDRGQDIPLGRLGRPEDISKAVSFFCSEDADYITGQSLHVNGGLYQS
ncbi:MAG: SDR family NAD(P)-dependent oxidoreductase [Gammaproteobacteria bacterium]|nr:SDR family NAD(P)-dependent oxidoreductase [Gammaproteobacteria bacterium]MDE0511430.1 SDR family NAD(P)-dependent oxidoreductase [Gammaproteobacteria bacterium]